MRRKYGEEYAQLIPDVETATLQQWKWVAQKVKPDTRRGAPLSWSHHLVVAGLDDDAEQRKYLDIAVNNELSVTALRKLVQGEKPKKPKQHVCPECGHEWEV